MNMRPLNLDQGPNNREGEVEEALKETEKYFSGEKTVNELTTIDEVKKLIHLISVAGGMGVKKMDSRLPNLLEELLKRKKEILTDLINLSDKEFEAEITKLDLEMLNDLKKILEERISTAELVAVYEQEEVFKKRLALVEAEIKK